MNEYFLPICHGHGQSVRLVRLLRPVRWGAARPELTLDNEGGTEPEARADSRRVTLPGVTHCGSNHPTRDLDVFRALVRRDTPDLGGRR
jgi:hypothetical protein